MGYRVASQTFGVLVLSCALVTIWQVLVGGLGEPEDEDDEKDSLAGAGRGGGEGVCDGGGSGGGEESMVGPVGPEAFHSSFDDD